MNKNNRFLGSPRISKNVIWNIIGSGMPLLVAVIAVPILIKNMGTARFGVLTLAWTVVGYFSLFDMGLSRALTKIVSEKLGLKKVDEIPVLVFTALSIMIILGLLGMVILAGVSPWFVMKILKIPEFLQRETLNTFYLLAATIPIVILATGLRGVLEAYQQFKLVNLVRIPLGIFTYLGPLTMLPFSNSLVPSVGTLFVIRLVACFVYIKLCLIIVPELRKTIRFRSDLIKPLFSYGNWITVSSIISPLMTYMDRFVIGAVVSVTAVAYYVTPFEILTKFMVIPAAFLGALFPAFAASFVSDRHRLAKLYKRAIGYLYAGMFPLVFIVMVFAKQGLIIWLGEDFAKNSYLIFQILAIGVFSNSSAVLALGLIQASGRPDLTAKLHLIELPLYLLVFWWLINSYGILGAAIAWTLRVLFDMVAMIAIAERINPTKIFSYLLPLHIGALGIITAGVLMPNPIIKVIYLIIILILFTIGFWFRFLENDERIKALKLIRSRPFND